MKPSQLKAIVNRLESMVNDEIEPNIRRFEKDGKERCQVQYHRAEDTFELFDQVHENKYKFDELDLVAIEIFDLLQ